jgi:predicted RNA-binding Zn ribbon-like protein
VVTELKIVGGDPALDLANTVGDDRVPDPLDNDDSFAAWTARIGVGRPRPGDHIEARALRTVVDAVFRPLANGRDPAPEALEQLARRAGAAVERARFDGRRLVWDEDPVSELAVAALDLLRSGPLERLKACEDCPWLFLDLSRNHSRRWCSMEDCGTRVKMRRYRARQASTSGRAPRGRVY